MKKKNSRGGFAHGHLSVVGGTEYGILYITGSETMGKGVIIKKCSLVLLLFLVSIVIPLNSYAHPDKNTHAYEISRALGFDYHPKIHDWLCYISSDMIDKHQPFYSMLTTQFPGFKCKHRVLFHWNFNGIPWTPGLENKVVAYTRLIYGSDKYRQYIPQVKESFLKTLRKEQKRRNGIINKKTETLFGFATGGKDASYANFFASMAYDLHILGDYTSKDNTDLNGLVEFNTLINGIISTINRLDSRQGKNIVKEIKRVNSSKKDVQLRADDIMKIIQNKLPEFVKTAQEGSIKRRLEKRGYTFLK